MIDSKRGRRQGERPGGDGRDGGNDRLRAVLRRGDPDGDGRTLSPAERAALRRLIVGAARSSSAPAWPPLPAIAASLVAVVTVAAASLYWLRPAGHNDPARVAGRAAVERPAAAAGTMVVEPPAGGTAAGHPPSGVAADGPGVEIDSDAPPTIRNVQFVTAGGTRIVWVLNRNLDI
jgi:hypothetical protein